MRKLYLSVIGFSFLCRLNVYSQTSKDSIGIKPATFTLYRTPDQQQQDTAQYNPRQLRLDEVNFVSSYYWQDGNHSAITGGIGTEKVTDIANGIDLHFVWLNQSGNINRLAAGLGFDYHTAASQAYVSQSGASKTTGTRLYPSLDWTVENTKSGNAFGIGAYYSGEYNYKSFGTDLHFSAKTNNKSGEFTARLQGYFDQVKLIYPSEFVPHSTTTVGTTITSASGLTESGSGGHHRANIPSSPRNSYSASLGYSQIINSRLQIAFLADLVGQNGYLGLPFHRVYFSTGKDTIEKLPSTRYKLPVGCRLNYFLDDNIILRTYYRYYWDTWGVRSNTAGLEAVYKISPFFSVSPFYRFYNQSAAKYFAPYGVHSPTDEYYTSNYEYAKFNSQFFGMGFRIAPPGGVFGWHGLHDMEIRYGHYSQTTDLVSNVISLNLGFK
jgi:hypothetical protein